MLPRMQRKYYVRAYHPSRWPNYCLAYTRLSITAQVGFAVVSLFFVCNAVVGIHNVLYTVLPFFTASIPGFSIRRDGKCIFGRQVWLLQSTLAVLPLLCRFLLW